MFLQVSVCPHGGVCVVLSGGHAWFYYGGGMHGFIPGGVHGFIRGCVRGFIQGACVVLLGGIMRGFIWGACMILFGGHAWFYLGGMHGFIWGACVVLFRGRAWFFQFFRIQWDTVNEQAVRILLECILVQIWIQIPIQMVSRMVTVHILGTDLHPRDRFLSQCYYILIRESESKSEPVEKFCIVQESVSVSESKSNSEVEISHQGCHIWIGSKFSDHSLTYHCFFLPIYFIFTKYNLFPPIILFCDYL